jgi:hypothetical protein
MYRSLWSRLVTPLIAVSLFAQAPPDGQSVGELLASSDPARLAWGAELAARNERQDFVPDIQRLLGWPDDRVKEHALDALIRLKAKVPAEELTPLPPKFKVQVIILATANGHRNILSSMLNAGEPHDATWVALNQSLMKIGGPRDYWPALLRVWTIHVVIYVTDPGRPAGSGPKTGSAMCGDGMSEPRSGFPARATYSLFLEAKPGYTVLDSNPHPVYYLRHSTSSGCDIRIDRDDYRGDFVGSVVHLETPLKGHLRYDMAWANDEAYIAEMNRLRAQTLGGFQQILDWMLKRRLIPPEDAVLRPHIVVGIEDQRSNQSRHLPATEPWE